MATIKKAQRGCAIARQTAKEDKKAIREWGKMSRMSDKQIDRQNRRDERRSRREEARDSRPSVSKIRGNFMFKNGGSTPAWQRKEGKNPSGGLNAKGVASYRKANPGSKLKTAVTTKPSKLKAGSKAANRRKSFCARMSGMKKRLTSAKTANDPNSRINKSLRKWNC